MDHILQVKIFTVCRWFGESRRYFKKTLEYINTIGTKLSLYPGSSIIDEDKKEMLRNLLDSEIPEEMIAEQLDLDIQTVRKLIQEMNK